MNMVFCDSFELFISILILNKKAQLLSEYKDFSRKTRIQFIP